METVIIYITLTARRRATNTETVTRGAGDDTLQKYKNRTPPTDPTNVDGVDSDDSERAEATRTGITAVIQRRRSCRLATLC